MNSYKTENGKIRNYTEELKIRTFDYSENFAQGKYNLIQSLKNLDIEAVVVKKFLSKNEIETLLNKLNIEVEAIKPIYESITFPFSFVSLNRENLNFKEELKSYYQKSKIFRDSFPQIFGIDMEQKFTSLLSILNQNKSAKVLSTSDLGSYIPFTFRVILPEKNHINLHADNLFPSLAPEFYALLNEVAEVKNQLSFFTVLQKPDIGGEVSVYNVAWDVAKEFNIEEQSIILENGIHLHAEKKDELFRQQFNLEEGDLILFAGGQLYHRIEEVYGSKMRITLGGFIGYSKTNTEIYYWS